MDFSDEDGVNSRDCHERWDFDTDGVLTVKYGDDKHWSTGQDKE